MENEVNYLTQQEQQFILFQHQKELASKTPLQAEEYLSAEDALNKYNFQKSMDFEKEKMHGRNLTGYVSDATMRMRNSPGKLRKAILGAIGTYNTVEIGMNNLALKKAYKTSPYTCGSVECKERGIKIKRALMNIAVLPANVLGAYAFADSVMMTANHFGQLGHRATRFGKERMVNDYNLRQEAPGDRSANAYKNMSVSPNFIFGEPHSQHETENPMVSDQEVQHTEHIVQQEPNERVHVQNAGKKTVRVNNRRKRYSRR